MFPCINVLQYQDLSNALIALSTSYVEFRARTVLGSGAIYKHPVLIKARPHRNSGWHGSDMHIKTVVGMAALALVAVDVLVGI